MDRRHRSEPKEVLSLGSTERVYTPEETLARIQAIATEAGITRTACLTHLDTFNIPVHTAIRPGSKNLATSQGKGFTDALSQCSALMESLEHYYAETVREDLHASVEALSEPHLFDDLQLGAIQPHALGEIAWTRCSTLDNKDSILIPSDFLRFDLSKPSVIHTFFNHTSTGLASGNTFWEAVCHSLYENIERHHLHNIATFDQSFLSPLAVDLSTIDYAPAVELIAKITAQQAELIVCDITHHFEVPTYFCILSNTHPLRPLPHFSGSGAHLNRGVALCRAITEAVQSRLTFIAGSRDDMMPADFHLPTDEISIEGAMPYILQQDQPGLSLDEQTQCLTEALSARGLTPYYYEYTPEGCPISVVRTVIPGCET